MAQVLNPGGSRGSDDLGNVLRAVNLATDLYKFKLGKEQQDIINQRKLAKEKLEQEEKQRDQINKFTTSYQPVNKAPEGAPFIPVSNAPKGLKIPEGTTGFVPFDYTSKQRDIQRATTQKENEVIAQSEKEARTDKRINERREEITTANRVQNLLKKEEPIADQVLMRQLFRMSGDVGAIRQEDLRQLGASPELKEQFLQFYNSLKEGDVIRPEARESIRNIANVLSEVAKKDINNRIQSISSSLARQVSSLNQDQAAEILRKQVLFDIEEGVPFNQQDQNKNRNNVSGGFESKAIAAPNYDNMSDDQFLDSYLGK